MKILYLKEFEMPAEATQLILDLTGDTAGDEVASDIYLEVSMVEDDVEMYVKAGCADDAKPFSMAVINTTNFKKSDKIVAEGLYVIDGAGASYLQINNTGACKLRVKALV